MRIESVQEKGNKIKSIKIDLGFACVDNDLIGCPISCGVYVDR